VLENRDGLAQQLPDVLPLLGPELFHPALYSTCRRQKRARPLGHLSPGSGPLLRRSQEEPGVGQQPLAHLTVRSPKRAYHLAHLPARKPLARDRLPEPLARPLAAPCQLVERPRGHRPVDLPSPHPLLHARRQPRHDLLSLLHPSPAASQPTGDFLCRPSLRPLQLVDEPPLLQPARPLAPTQLLPQNERLTRPRFPFHRLRRLLLQSLERADRREALDDNPPFPFPRHHDRDPLAPHHGRQRFALRPSPSQLFVPPVQRAQLQLDHADEPLALQISALHGLTRTPPPSLSAASTSALISSFTARTIISSATLREQTSFAPIASCTSTHGTRRRTPLGCPSGHGAESRSLSRHPRKYSGLRSTHRACARRRRPLWHSGFEHALCRLPTLLSGVNHRRHTQHGFFLLLARTPQDRALRRSPCLDAGPAYRATGPVLASRPGSNLTSAEGLRPFG